MENASKALIIAGAILISILIIGLGVFIYQQAAGTVSRANLSSQEAMAQNQQFDSYFGDKVTAADVKALCSQVRSNNITSQTADETKKIAFLYGEATADTDTLETFSNVSIKSPASLSSTVKAGKTYKVGVANDTASKDDSDPTETSSTDKTSAYYSSGFIRIITVIQNK